MKSIRRDARDRSCTVSSPLPRFIIALFFSLSFFSFFLFFFFGLVMMMIIIIITTTLNNWFTIQRQWGRSVNVVSNCRWVSNVGWVNGRGGLVFKFETQRRSIDGRLAVLWALPWRIKHWQGRELYQQRPAIVSHWLLSETGHGNS